MAGLDGGDNFVCGLRQPGGERTLVEGSQRLGSERGQLRGLGQQSLAKSEPVQTDGR
ncbi:MAG: hypothetical protein ACXVUE_01910 [Solirubrobacteraceae bacterium]